MSLHAGEETDAATQISRTVVSLLRELSGRGATLARTTVADEHVVVVLEGTLTLGERTLAANGHGAMVTEARVAIHDIVGERARGVIEELLGRRVSAVMSSSHLESDRAASIFLLEPTHPSR